MTNRDGVALALTLFGLFVPSVSMLSGSKLNPGFKRFAKYGSDAVDKELVLNYIADYCDFLESKIENVHLILPEDETGDGVEVYKEQSGMQRVVSQNSADIKGNLLHKTNGKATEKRGRKMRLRTMWDSDIFASLTNRWNVRIAKRKYQRFSKKLGEAMEIPGDGFRNNWECLEDATDAYIKMRFREAKDKDHRGDEEGETLYFNHKAFWFLEDSILKKDSNLIALVDMVMHVRDGCVVGVYKLDEIGGQTASLWRIYHLSIDDMKAEVKLKAKYVKKEILLTPHLFVAYSKIAAPPTTTAPAKIKTTHSLFMNSGREMGKRKGKFIIPGSGSDDDEESKRRKVVLDEDSVLKIDDDDEESKRRKIIPGSGSNDDEESKRRKVVLDEDSVLKIDDDAEESKRRKIIPGSGSGSGSNDDEESQRHKVILDEDSVLNKYMKFDDKP